MENRTRYIPSIVMLAAAFAACIMSIYYDYTTKEILWIIVVFFVIGIIVKVIADKYLITTMEAEIENQSEDEEENSDNEENSMDDRDGINVETTPKKNKQDKK